MASSGLGLGDVLAMVVVWCVRSDVLGPWIGFVCFSLLRGFYVFIASCFWYDGPFWEKEKEKEKGALSLNEDL